MSESELEKTKAMLYEIREALWHHCLEDESENEVMMRAYPNGPKDVPAFFVNAKLIDRIYQMCCGYKDDLGNNDYPKPTP